MTSAKDEQRERRAVLRNDRRVHEASTYIDHVRDDTSGGRYAKQTPQYVTGSTSIPQYPAQPGSSWSNQSAAVPPEEPLGIAIDALEPTGTFAEIQQSILETGEEGVASSSYEAGDPSHPPTSPASGGGAGDPPGLAPPGRRPPRRRKD
jgi:hypothetical protein